MTNNSGTNKEVARRLFGCVRAQSHSYPAENFGEIGWVVILALALVCSPTCSGLWFSILSGHVLSGGALYILRMTINPK